MNVLGFVSAILIIITFSLTSMHHDLINLSKLHSSYLSYSEGSRSAQNEWEIAYYKSLRKTRTKEEIPKSDSNSAKLKPDTPLKEEKWENMPECARLNLALLLQKDQDQDQERKKLFAKIIKTLYGKNLLSGTKKNSSIENALLEEIFAKKDTTAFFLQQIKCKDPEIKTLFYHMLKGSSSKAENKYPSLLDYVKINLENPHEKICIACADLEMLTALFGEKAAFRINAKKDTTMERLRINKNDLQTILLEENHRLPDEDFWNLIKFCHQHKRKTAITVTGKGEESTVKKTGYLAVH